MCRVGLYVYGCDCLLTAPGQKREDETWNLLIERVRRKEKKESRQRDGRRRKEKKKGVKRQLPNDHEIIYYMIWSSLVDQYRS